MIMINTLNEYNDFLGFSNRAVPSEMEVKNPFSGQSEIVDNSKKLKKVMIAADMDKKILYLFDGSLLKNWNPEVRREYTNCIVEYAVDGIDNLKSHPERFLSDPKEIDNVGMVSLSHFNYCTGLNIGHMQVGCLLVGVY